MRFLLIYSSAYDAQQKGWPLAGSVLELGGLEDLVGLHARFGGSRLVISPSMRTNDYAPHWLESVEAGWFDEEDRRSYHVGETLPDGWRDLPVIEVYNGWRE